MARRRDNAAPLPQHVSVRVCPRTPAKKQGKITRELLTSRKSLVRHLFAPLFAKSNGALVLQPVSRSSDCGSSALVSSVDQLFFGFCFLSCFFFQQFFSSDRALRQRL